MYYNIKIKSQNSEFILESSNKNITQREMDIYFACIFNASKEFISKIKKVEINDAAVKSIKEIEEVPAPSVHSPIQPIEEIKESAPQELNSPIQKIGHVQETPQPKNEQLQSAEKIQHVQETLHPKNEEIQHVQEIEISNPERIKSIQDVPAPSEHSPIEEIQFKEESEIKIENTQTLPYEEKIILIKPTIIPIKSEVIVTPAEQTNKPIGSIESIMPIEIQQHPQPYEQPFKNPMQEITIPANSEINAQKDTQQEVKFVNEEIKTPELESSNPTENIVPSENKEESLNSAENVAKDENTATSENLDDLLELVQKEIASIDINPNNEFEENLMDVFEENKKPETNNSDSLEIKDDVIQFDLPEEPEKPAELNFEYSEEQKKQFEDNYKSKLENIFSDETSAEENYTNTNSIASNPEENIENGELKIESNETINSSIENKDENQPINSQNNEINTGAAQPENSQHENLPIENTAIKNTEDENPTSHQGPVLDFKLFLSGFIVSELVDEFLICAYYIKNILRQENFTMKFINSKLFAATNRIADMSIVEELIIKEYLKTIDTGESVKYCITSDGEGYFTGKFQG